MHQTLTTRRAELDLRLEDASRLSGLSVPTIRMLESGRGNLGSLLRYTKALGLCLNWHGLNGRGYGTALASRRQDLGISQRALAAKIGSSHRTIIALENHFKGRVDTLLRCLHELRLRPTLRLMEQTTIVADDAAHDQDIIRVLNADPRGESEIALIHSDALTALRSFPANIIDCVVTSPPYWQQRSYEAGGIGEEHSVDEYLAGLRAVFRQVHRVLKPTGSLWINIDDSYHAQSMQGIPWRLVLGMVEDNGWLIRNDVIWNKLGGALNRSSNRLTHRHEHMFHMVKSGDYYHNTDAIRQPATPARLDQPKIATATGITYKASLDRINASNLLKEDEKKAAIIALDHTFADIKAGKLHDFRLVLRGNRVTHSDNQSVSARASKLDGDGFYILRYDPQGSLMGDVWDISPDRTKGRSTHYAAFPEALCEIPIRSTCPPSGVVLDPFVGTGTTLRVAQRMGRHGIGIDLSTEYVAIAAARLGLDIGYLTWPG